MSHQFSPHPQLHTAAVLQINTLSLQDGIEMSHPHAVKYFYSTYYNYYIFQTRCNIDAPVTVKHAASVAKLPQLAHKHDR